MTKHLIAVDPCPVGAFSLLGGGFAVEFAPAARRTQGRY